MTAKQLHALCESLVGLPAEVARQRIDEAKAGGRVRLIDVSSTGSHAAATPIGGLTTLWVKDGEVVGLS